MVAITTREKKTTPNQRKAREKKAQEVYVCTDGLQLQVQKKKNAYAYTMEGHDEVTRSSKDQVGRRLMHPTLGWLTSAILMKISSAGCLYKGALNVFWSR
jgi:hypothetical protein